MWGENLSKGPFPRGKKEGEEVSLRTNGLTKRREQMVSVKKGPQNRWGEMGVNVSIQKIVIKEQSRRKMYQKGERMESPRGVRKKRGR